MLRECGQCGERVWVNPNAIVCVNGHLLPGKHSLVRYSALRGQTPKRRVKPKPAVRPPRVEMVATGEAAIRFAANAGYFESQPGSPLGHGYPTGAPMRRDGETHRDAWKRIVRFDPCAYCGAQPAGTLDHIVPVSAPAGGLGGLHWWGNYTGACERCNWGKSDSPLVLWLAGRQR